jgi:hypothetical protein
MNGLTTTRRYTQRSALRRSARTRPHVNRAAVSPPRPYLPGASFFIQHFQGLENLLTRKTFEVLAQRGWPHGRLEAYRLHRQWYDNCSDLRQGDVAPCWLPTSLTTCVSSSITNRLPTKPAPLAQC